VPGSVNRNADATLTNVQRCYRPKQNTANSATSKGAHSGAELFKKGAEYGAIQFAAQRISRHRFATKPAENQRERVAGSGDPSRLCATLCEAAIGFTQAEGTGFEPARGFLPHHISSVAANHSLTLPNYLRYHILRYAGSTVK
jgi:hypothetical protein